MFLFIWQFQIGVVIRKVRNASQMQRYGFYADWENANIGAFGVAVERGRLFRPNSQGDA